MKSEHAIAQQEQRNSADVEVFGVGVKGPGTHTTPSNPTQVLDEKKATRHPPPPQQQEKEAVSLQLYSEMAMKSEIIMQPQPNMSEPQPQFKERNKTNNCFHENLNFLI